jgi:tetratricopeptide (TPR) repeat protein
MSMLNDTYWTNQIEVQHREVMAWIAEKSGKNSDAIATMRSAAELEDSMDKHAVTPGAVTPGREMLAELLLMEKRPQQSLAEYQAVLKVAPNRFNALYGASQAADAAGNTVAASEYLRKLTEIAVGEERPELAAARKKMASVATPR